MLKFIEQLNTMKLEYVILTILVFGVFGGLINKFRDNDTKSKYWISIVKGIGAAMIVPLFLELVKSGIISKGEEGWYNYFVFGGLCTITAIFSDKFFDSIGEKILSKVENVENTVNELEESKKEIDNAEQVIYDSIKFDKKEDQQENIKKVINAIVDSKYSYRTITGIKKETSLGKDEIEKILINLKDNKLAESKRNSRGNDIWKIILTT